MGAKPDRVADDDRKGGVQEVKFLVRPDQIEGVLGWMRNHLEPDPHGSGGSGDAYRVESLYFDTAGFDVYHRRGSFGRAKFRIRRYGLGNVIFLERKLKRGGVVRKRRVGVEPGMVGHLTVPVNGEVWQGSWFHRRTQLRALQPMVMMNYSRIARLGRDAGRRFRVTLDRDLLATRMDRILVPERIDGQDLLRGAAVLEVKFVETLPAVFRRLIEDLGLQTTGFSKFRLGLRHCGLVTEPAPESAEADGAEQPAVG